MKFEEKKTKKISWVSNDFNWTFFLQMNLILFNYINSNKNSLSSFKVGYTIMYIV